MADTGPGQTPRRTPATLPKGERRSRRALCLLIGFVACVLAVDALIGERGLLETLRARRQYNQLQAGINSLKSKNARLCVEDVDLASFRISPILRDPKIAQQPGRAGVGSYMFWSDDQLLEAVYKEGLL